TPATAPRPFAGRLFSLSVMTTKQGDKMGFITLAYRSARIAASLFAEAFHSAQSLLQTASMVVVEGEVSNDDFSGGLRLRATRVMSIEDARTNLAESLRVTVRAEALKGHRLRWLGDLCKRHRAACPTPVDYTGPDPTACPQLGEAS
ncbi:DNA polymerase III subunit alpha, partial [Pseudomonas syringae]